MYASLVFLGAVVFLAIGRGQAFPMRWCTTSDKETEKCNAFKPEMAKLANASNLVVDFACFQGMSAEDCMKRIQAGTADLITLDGGEIYDAGKKYEMVPIVGEDYGTGFGTSYFAVAVVKKNSDITFKTLKGKKSCHTGAGKTSGWNVPVGFLLSEKIMTQDGSCNSYVSAGKFFKESCVPKVQLKKLAPSNLCALCKDECTTAGKYSGYAGAFQCLKDGVGEVAFVKHTTVPENAGNVSNYQYLCRDGKKSDTYNNCYLAKVPSHAVMTKVENSYNAKYRQLLIEASDAYGITQNDSSKFQLFNSTNSSGKDLLFKDSTKKLVDVGNKNTYKLWLGKEYVDDIEALAACPPTAGSVKNKLQLLVAAFSFIALLFSGVLFK